MSLAFNDIGYNCKPRGLSINGDNFKIEWGKLTEEDREIIRGISRSMHGRFWDKNLSLINSFNDFNGRR